MGRDTEFEAALRKLRGKKADISEEAAEIQVLKSCKMDKASHDLKHTCIILDRIISRLWRGFRKPRCWICFRGDTYALFL